MTLLILTGLPVLLCDLASRPSLLNVNLPTPDFDEATRVGHSLTVSLSKGPLEIGRFNSLASCVSENCQR